MDTSKENVHVCFTWIWIHTFRQTGRLSIEIENTTTSTREHAKSKWCETQLGQMVFTPSVYISHSSWSKIRASVRKCAKMMWTKLRLLCSRVHLATSPKYVHFNFNILNDTHTHIHFLFLRPDHEYQRLFDRKKNISPGFTQLVNIPGLLFTTAFG